LADLFNTFPKEIQDKAPANKLDITGVVVFSEAPGIPYYRSHNAVCCVNMLRCRLLNSEWKNRMWARRGEHSRALS
jgi:hypothetical protein